MAEEKPSDQSEIKRERKYIALYCIVCGMIIATVAVTVSIASKQASASEREGERRKVIRQDDEAGVYRVAQKKRAPSIPDFWHLQVYNSFN